MIRIERIRRYKGYRVIEHIHVGEIEFAIGYCKMEVFPYATFCCKNGKSYLDKISFATLDEAQRNLIERMNKEINFYRPFREIIAKDTPKVIGGKINA